MDGYFAGLLSNHISKPMDFMSLRSRRLKPSRRNTSLFGVGLERRAVSALPMLADGAPDAVRGGGHRDVGDPKRGQRVEDRIDHRRRAGNRAAFADTFDAEWVGRARDGAEIGTDRRQYIGARDAVIH